MHIEEDVQLAPLTTLQVGGNARFFARANSVEDVREAIAFADSRRLPIFVLGGGSNVLISDRGWPGLALQIGILGIERKPAADTLFEVGAGEHWDAFVAHAVERNCAGIECLSGIPGSVGGTPVQNVGAYGQEVAETIASVLVFDRREKSSRQMSGAECGFRYRASIFNSTERDRYIILRVTYALHPNGDVKLRYADLQKYFAQNDRPPTLAQTRQAVLSIRATKGMLITAGDPDSRSAGSFFKNPVLTVSQYEDLTRRARERNLQVPSYPALSEQKKISAAWLVENSGFKKGYIKGHAAISGKHALALVNRGGASAGEMVALKDEIQQQVQHTWGISLEPEPIFIGF